MDNRGLDVQEGGVTPSAPPPSALPGGGEGGYQRDSPPPPYSAVPPPPPQQGPTPSAPSRNMADDESKPFSDNDDFNYGYNFEFNDKTIRNGFIRKVYSILMVQLIITLGFICIFLYVEPVRQYSRENVWLWVVALILTFVCIIALACCPDVRRKSPTNFIFLGLFTLCESYLLGSVAACYDADAVMIAVGITAVVSFGLTVFAFQTKIDFTMCSGGLLVALLVLMAFGFLAIIIRSQILNLVYASLGALIFGLYLVFDTQLMIGGKHKYSISPEEYIFAALNLYLDIINLFLYILTIVGAARGH